MANPYDGKNGNGYQPIAKLALKQPATTEYRFSGDCQPIPLSLIIIGAMSVGFILGCAI